MKERSRAALLDTNLLLLWLAGNVDMTLLNTFKRVQDFTAKDYDVLRAAVLQYRDLLTIPHVLTETSNFIQHAPPHRRDDLASALTRFVQNTVEVRAEARQLVLRPEFRRLGITD